MVRILSNGDIVPDDDPRAQSHSRSSYPNSAQSGQNQVILKMQKFKFTVVTIALISKEL